jgi:hypothetical protein
MHAGGLNYINGEFVTCCKYINYNL